MESAFFFQLHATDSINLMGPVMCQRYVLKLCATVFALDR